LNFIGFRGNVCTPDFILLSLLVLNLQLQLAHRLDVLLDGSLSIGVGSVGVVQGDLELVDVRLELLLDAQSLLLVLGLGFEGGLQVVVICPETQTIFYLHGLESSLVVLASVLELLLLLLDALLDLGSDLRNFDLGAQDLRLFGLQSGLGLVQSLLQYQIHGCSNFRIQFLVILPGALPSPIRVCGRSSAVRGQSGLPLQAGRSSP